MFLKIFLKFFFENVLYPFLGNDEILLECDAELYPKVFKHLKMYKIRKKVQLQENPDNYQVGHLFSNTTDLNERELYDYRKGSSTKSFFFGIPLQLKLLQKTLVQQKWRKYAVLGSEAVAFWKTDFVAYRECASS